MNPAPHFFSASSPSLRLGMTRSPQAFPPVLRRRRLGDVHLLPHHADLPPGEARGVLRLLLLSRAQVAPVLPRRVARCRACPGVMEDVARLEVLRVAGLLKDEVLGEVRAVVADVQPRDERRRAAASLARPPPDAELAQLRVRERFGSARVAPLAVPGVLEEDRAHLLAPHLLAEERLVERAELLLHEERHVAVARQLD